MGLISVTVPLRLSAPTLRSKAGGSLTLDMRWLFAIIAFTITSISY